MALDNCDNGAIEIDNNMSFHCDSYQILVPATAAVGFAVLIIAHVIRQVHECTIILIIGCY